MRNFLIRVLPLVAFLLSQPLAEGAIIQGPYEWAIADGGNGHFYQFVDYGAAISWTSARDDAASMVLNGSTGHLVSVTSAAEDSFLQTTFQSFIGDPNTGVSGIYAWIGLSDAAIEGNYQWVTGEPFTYSNWAPFEPNNLGPEDYVHLWRRNFDGTPRWSWNDAGNVIDSPTYSGSLVEFDGPFSSPVPEPSTLLLWLIGGLAMALAAVCRAAWQVNPTALGLVQPGN